MLNAFGTEICADFVVMLTMLSVCRCRVGVAACHCGQTPSKNTPANCQRQLCAEGTTTLWKTQKSLMKIACKWFLFLPACHVMVARFACKTFGLLSARHTHTDSSTCSGYVPNRLKRKVCPGHGHGSRVCPTLLTANFRIFFSTLCVGVVDCSWSCAHTHMSRHPHILVHYTNSVCRGNSCSPASTA